MQTATQRQPSAAQRFKSTSTRNPCPICGNTSGHCKSKAGDRGDALIYCHNHESDPGQPIAGYKWLKACDGWGIFAPVDSDLSVAKSYQPQETRRYIYADAAGNELIRVNRADDGSGGKKIWQEYLSDGVWVKKADEVPAEVKAAAKASVMPYRYAEVMAAAAQGQRIYWVEGEKCADRLWELGLPATTTIGGSDSYSRYGDYSQVFAGVDLVICPDRDQSGLKYADAIAADYPDAQWLYAFPDSAEWDSLPKSGGLDIVDWVASGANKAAIEAAVESRREKPPANKVISLHGGAPVVSIDSLEDRIAAILDQNPNGPTLRREKARLCQCSGLSERAFNEIWEGATADYDAEAIGDRVQIEQLINATQSTLNLSQILPSAIAEPLQAMAERQYIRPEVFLLLLLSVVGTLAQNTTKLVMSFLDEFEVSPNIYAAIVAPPSARKSPSIKTVVSRPLKILKKSADEAYQIAHEAWQIAKEEARSSEPPKPFDDPEPVREMFYFTKTTLEGIANQATRCPHRGLLWSADELKGLFGQLNKYTGGKGDDVESLLSLYDGNGDTTLRASGVTADVDALNFGIVGGIQPAVLSKLVAGGDPDGKWSRFLFVNQPQVAATLADDTGPQIHNVSSMLAEYYQTIANQLPQQYTLSPAAFKLFQRTYNDLEQRKIAESRAALQSVIGKSAGRIGKLALCLHLVESAVTGVFSPEVQESTIAKAVLITEFGIEQIRAIYADSDPEDRLNPVMARIIEISRQKGAVTASIVSQGLSVTHRTPTAEIRQLFIELERQGFGVVEGEAKKITFTAHSEPLAADATIEVDEGDDLWWDTGFSADDLARMNSDRDPEIPRGTVVEIERILTTENTPDNNPEKYAEISFGGCNPQSKSVWLYELQRDDRLNLGEWEAS